METGLGGDREVAPPAWEPEEEAELVVLMLFLVIPRGCFVSCPNDG